MFKEGSFSAGIHWRCANDNRIELRLCKKPNKAKTLIGFAAAASMGLIARTMTPTTASTDNRKAPGQRAPYYSRPRIRRPMLIPPDRRQKCGCVL
jgi:hypothetical protein